MKKIIIIIFMISQLIICSESNYDLYQEQQAYLKNQAQNAKNRLARLNKLKSVPKEYPNVARLAAEFHDPEIDKMVKDSNSWFPSINSVECLTSNNSPIVKKSWPWPSNSTVYKKNKIDRLINAKIMQKVIRQNDLEHIAIANKSLVQDSNGQWIIAVEGIESNPSTLENSYSLANSLTIDEIKDLCKLAEETGFLDWSDNNMNMIRNKNNNNKLTIIDTENRSIQPADLTRWMDLEDNSDIQVPFTIPLTQLDVIKQIKESLNITELEKIERLYTEKNDPLNFKIKPEVREWINNRISELKKTQPKQINSIISDKNKYILLPDTINKIEALNEFHQMNKKQNDWHR